MRVRTVAVKPTEVNNPTTIAANRLWAELFSMTAVNEDVPENRADAHLMADYRAKFGPWKQRLEKGIADLTAFYGDKFGEKGTALIKEYWATKYYLLSQNDDHPMVRRFREAQRQMRELHDGYIVDGYDIRRLGEELREGEYSMFYVEV